MICTDQKLRRGLIFTLQVSQCCHHGVLGCEIHEHLHPDLLLESLHDVGLVLQLLPQLGDGGVCLLLQGGEAPLQVGHLAGQQRNLRGEQSVVRGVSGMCAVPPPSPPSSLTDQRVHQAECRFLLS